MKRLFLGIPLSDDGKTGLAKFREENQHLTGVRWTAYENLHITLLFIGNYDEKLVAGAVIKLRKTFESIQSFKLIFEKLCLIRFKKKPRMFWAQFKQSAEFDNLVNQCALLFPDSKQYVHHDNIPHITIARIKSLIDERDVQYISEIQPADVVAEKCVLWESVTRPSGPEYREVAELICRH